MAPNDSINGVAAAAASGSPDASGDWLATYLVATKVAEDPRLSSSNLRAIAALNVKHLKQAVTAAAAAGSSPSSAKVQDETAAPPDGNKAAASAAAKLAAAKAAGVIPLPAELARQDTPEDFAAWMADSKRHRRRGGHRKSQSKGGEGGVGERSERDNEEEEEKGSRRRKHRASVGAKPGDEAGMRAKKDAEAAASEASSGANSSERRDSRGGGGGGGGGGVRRTGRASICGPSPGRISMSGRRSSLDYSDLDAIRERLLQAAHMWATKDDGSTDNEEEEEGPDSPRCEAPSPAAGKADSAAKADGAAKRGSLLGLSGRKDAGEGVEAGGAEGQQQGSRPLFARWRSKK